MTIEMDDGTYERIRIINQGFVDSLNNQNKREHKMYDFKFHFIPKGYFQNNGNYIFAFEIRAFHEMINGTEYYFIAENLFVSYPNEKIKQLIKDDEASILGMDSQVRYLKS